MSVASALVRPLRKLPQRLWPYTLGKFWGLHALMWAAARQIPLQDANVRLRQ
jgi:hypothetical protein